MELIEAIKRFEDENNKMQTELWRYCIELSNQLGMHLWYRLKIDEDCSTMHNIYITVNNSCGCCKFGEVRFTDQDLLKKLNHYKQCIKLLKEVDDEYDYMYAYDFVEYLYEWDEKAFFRDNPEVVIEKYKALNRNKK